ncbi:MAG: DNA repair protein RecN [Candidatus Syntrophonatronum acetioxidans]|uniref:DNA repair protein RecN n=1 Tax=Candidatus Syntrophonatronum acetioxidans TaxID=1795816 RepID=A0A424YF98_9FIRM|nr:MAG: DNA repair protein RecN [Candidatus Syntrophonatronum acetioxidans]
MLTELYIKDFALIDEMKLSFDQGLNIMTGETGAGKSIIIEAVKLILGGRAAGELIRSGKDRAIVEAVFQVSSSFQENLLQEVAGDEGMAGEEDLLFLGRELSSTGKNICRLNGRMIPLNLYREAGQFLIELHGQGQQQLLSKPSYHLELLDNLAGREVQRHKEEIKRLLKEREKVSKELNSLYLNDEEKERKLDFLRHQTEEISRASLSPGEEESLKEEKEKMDNLDKLKSRLGFVYEELYGGSSSPSLVERLGTVKKELEYLSSLEDSLSSREEIVEEALSLLTETGLDIKEYLDNLFYDPEKMEEIQARLELINYLKRKYGPALEDIINYGEKVEEEIEHLLKSEERARKLGEELEELKKELTRISEELSQLRKETARYLENSISEVLNQLEMPQALFQVSLERQDFFTGEGFDQVEFFFSANPGEPLKPLSKIASGGEMSRIMLAFRAVSAQADKIPTIVFDEVDAGIGGSALQAVGEKLSTLSRSRQVICVTHSPQIASMADSHYLITKEYQEGRTLTSVNRLEEEERNEEIARMIDGSKSSSLTLKHAEEILRKAHAFKKQDKT